MKTFTLLFIAICAVLPATAQRHKLGVLNAETPEGKILQAIGTEQDEAKKLALMEDFVAKFGKHEGAAWVYSQMQPAYTKAGNHDKALDAGQKLLELDPLSLEAAYGNLKASEAKKDGEGILKWAGATSAIARKTAEAPKAADESDDDRKRAVDYAKQVDTYTEYALYAASLGEADPARTMKLVEALEKQNAASPYLLQAMPKYGVAARQANALPAAVQLGERAFARGQVHEDLLLVMADFYLNAKQSPEKVVQYSTKVTELLQSKPKPDGMSDADWDRKKTTTSGVAYWMAGTTLSTQGKHAEADKALRSALPLVKDNDQLTAGALFHLGLVNYQMGKGRNAQQMAEAMKFMTQCAAMKSPFQGQAQKNLAVMKKETGAAKK